MKKKYSVKIPNPCSENWENLSPASRGRYCSSCQKNVMDFTFMSEKEIIDILQKNTSVCGHFHSGQLKNYEQGVGSPFVSNFPGMGFLKSGIVSLLMILAARQGISKEPKPVSGIEWHQGKDQVDTARVDSEQGHIVKGVVVDRYKDPLPGVNVILVGSRTGTVTDINGRFEFPVKLKEKDVLVFSYIGFLTRQFVVPKHSSEVIEIPLLKLEFDITGEVVFTEIYEEPTKQNRFWEKVKNWF